MSWPPWTISFSIFISYRVLPGFQIPWIMYSTYMILLLSYTSVSGIQFRFTLCVGPTRVVIWIIIFIPSFWFPFPWRIRGKCLVMSFEMVIPNILWTRLMGFHVRRYVIYRTFYLVGENSFLFLLKLHLPFLMYIQHWIQHNKDCYQWLLLDSVM